MTGTLNLAERLKQTKGREPRSQSVATRFTPDEEGELATAAEGSGMNVREWAREVLLREARRSKGDAVFTEVIATRILLNNVLRVLISGQTMTPENFDNITATIRVDKHRAARETMQQYTSPDHKGQ